MSSYSVTNPAHRPLPPRHHPTLGSLWEDACVGRESAAAMAGKTAPQTRSKRGQPTKQRVKSSGSAGKSPMFYDVPADHHIYSDGLSGTRRRTKVEGNSVHPSSPSGPLKHQSLSRCPEIGSSGTHSTQGISFTQLQVFSTPKIAKSSENGVPPRSHSPFCRSFRPTALSSPSNQIRLKGPPKVPGVKRPGFFGVSFRMTPGVTGANISSMHAGDKTDIVQYIYYIYQRASWMMARPNNNSPKPLNTSEFRGDGGTAPSEGSGTIRSIKSTEFAVCYVDMDRVRREGHPSPSESSDSSPLE